MFSALLASKLLHRLACAPIWQLVNRAMLVTRAVKEACCVPTVAMCRYALGNECNFIYMLMPTVEQVCGCVYDVGEDKIIFCNRCECQPPTRRSRTMLRL